MTLLAKDLAKLKIEPLYLISLGNILIRSVPALKALSELVPAKYP